MPWHVRATRQFFSSMQQWASRHKYNTKIQHNTEKCIHYYSFITILCQIATTCTFYLIIYFFPLRFYYLSDNLLLDFSMHAIHIHSAHVHVKMCCKHITTETTRKFIALDSCKHIPSTPPFLSRQSKKKFSVDRFNIAHTYTNILHIRMFTVCILYISRQCNFFWFAIKMIDDDTTTKVYVLYSFKC